MRRGLLLASIVAFALLAGCNVGDDDEARPTPRVVSRPTIATVETKTPAELHLMSLDVLPATVDLGQRIEAVARVVNVGEERGGATVLFEIVGGPNATASAPVTGKGSADVRASLTPTAGGNLAVRARLGDEENTTTLLVRAPRIANLTVVASSTGPCGALRLTLGLDNVGDATARNVRGDLDVLDEADAPIVSLRATIGDVPPGEHGAAVVDVQEGRTACEGEEPRVFGVRLVVQTDALADAQLTGVVTA